MTLDAPVDPADVPAHAPDWRLKVIPRADGPGAAVHQLIDASGAGSDGVVAAAFRGAAASVGRPAVRPHRTGRVTTRARRAGYETSFREGYARVGRHDLRRDCRDARVGVRAGRSRRRGCARGVSGAASQPGASARAPGSAGGADPRAASGSCPRVAARQGAS